MTKSRDTADSINRIDSSAADATAITIDANENVGIGTSSLSAGRTLTINNSTSSAVSLEQNGTEKHFSGIAASASYGVNGSASGDYFARTSGGKMLFSTDGGTTANATLDGSGHVGIGTSLPQGDGIHIKVPDNGTGVVLSGTTTTAGTEVKVSALNEATTAWHNLNIGSNTTIFRNAGSESMRILSSGTLCVDTTGTYLSGSDRIVCAGVLAVNSPTYAAGFNVASDGNNIFIMQGGATEGIISVSGNTVTYGGFTGSHWGRLDDNSKPEILRGTVLETTGNMIDWYRAEFTVTKQETDENGVVSDITETKSHEIAKPDGVNVGDTFDYVLADDNEWDIPAGTYTATLLQEGDVKHVHTKVSDTLESKAVYGVFGHWDYDCADNVNDMQVASLGTYIVRINSGETVSIGDLLDSNGDGTAKVQSDDIIRARTIGKVISTVKQETYSDGSYTVPCAIYCG